MAIQIVARTLGMVLAVWLTLVALFVARGMLRQTIVMSGILRDRDHPEVGPRLDRLQMLVATVGIAVFYVVAALYAKQGTHIMPTLPNAALYLLGGSHALYLSGHTVRSVQAKRERSS